MLGIDLARESGRRLWYTSSGDISIKFTLWPSPGLSVAPCMSHPLRVVVTGLGWP